MIYTPYTNAWGFRYQNQTNGATTLGTSVTPGASNAEGAWTQVAAAANITTDVYWIDVCVSAGATSANVKSHLLDIGIDPAGGTSYTPWLSDLVCGNSATAAAGGRWWTFPCLIRAGSSVAVRVQGSNATAGTVRVFLVFYGKPKHPELIRPGAYTETIGTITGSSGVSFTPGNATWGTWTSLGTTTRPHHWVQLGWQIDNATMSAHGTLLQLGIGDGTTFHVILQTAGQMTTSEAITSFMAPGGWEIPAGATLYVRGNNSAAPVTGYNAVAVCCGG